MTAQTLSRPAPVNPIAFIFLVSGFAALIYQVVWQRVLYATFGINIESVTVIVSVFMFGLGVGSLVGGKLQEKFSGHSLKLFVAIELCIGLFGLISIPLIHAAGAMSSQSSLWALIETTYALLSLPTMLMGSTLPILVGYLERNTETVTGGATVAKLYAYNTLGSALAALLTVTVLFVVTGEQGTIIVAALCNAATAFFAWFLLGRHAQQPVKRAAKAEKKTAVSVRGFSHNMAMLLASTVGFVSLSCEIFWFRVAGFISGTRPQVFGILLSVFLAGIALGALEAREASLKAKDLHDTVWRALLKMAACAYFSIPLVDLISTSHGKMSGLIAAYATAGLVGYYSGCIFPLLCEGRDEKAEKTVVWVYFFNIIGSTAGCLLTGFVLLDIFPLGPALTLSCMVLFLPLVALAFAPEWKTKPALFARGACLGVMALAFSLQPVVYYNVIDRLVMKDRNFKYIVENRNGIVGIVADKTGDMIVGGGVYDGRFSIDPVSDANLIRRAYMIPVLHKAPKTMLEIGVSGGAWARVMSMWKPLQKMTNVEINPGYTGLIAKYPVVAPLLKNPKFNLVIDDGRRWLRLHPDARFDFILMNSSYYWRSNSTNILSKEFLELCRTHLNPGGVIYYNTTSARDSIYTAAHVFKHVVMVSNFAAASDAPFDITKEQRRKNLLQFTGDDGKPVFMKTKETQAVLEKLVALPLEDLHDYILKETNLNLVTDDNMAVEYKKITRLVWPHGIHPTDPHPQP